MVDVRHVRELLGSQARDLRAEAPVRGHGAQMRHAALQLACVLGLDRPDEDLLASGQCHGLAAHPQRRRLAMLELQRSGRPAGRAVAHGSHRTRYPPGVRRTDCVALRHGDGHMASVTRARRVDEDPRAVRTQSRVACGASDPAQPACAANANASQPGKPLGCTRRKPRPSPTSTRKAGMGDEALLISRIHVERPESAAFSSPGRGARIQRIWRDFGGVRAPEPHD